MVRIGTYRAPLPLRPRRRGQRYRNWTDVHDPGRVVSQPLTRAGFFTPEGIPTPNFLINPNGAIRMDPGMRVFTPKPRAVIDVSHRNDLQSLYEAYHWFDPRINYTAVREAVQKILLQTFNETVREGEEWIDRHVPKATGQLRESLKKQLHARTNLPDGVKLKLTIGSYVRYLPHVATMSPTRYRLQHAPPETRRVNYYGPNRVVILNDPEARHYFFYQLIFYLRQVLRLKLARAIMQISNRMRVPQYFFRQRIMTDDT